MGKNLSAVRATVRQLLNDEFVSSSDQDFASDELDLYIGNCLTEISDKIPYEVREVLTTIANSKVLDISSIDDLIRISHAEYPVGNDPPSYRNVEYLDGETLELQTSLVPLLGGSGTLTGTVTFATGSATVTGSGTLFSSELSANYLIKKSSGTRWYRVYSIESATSLTLAEPVRSSDNGADTVDLSEYCYESVYLYCQKLHQLTESSTTLSPQLEKALIDGVVANVALGWINQVRVQVKDALARVTDINTAITGMSARITQAGHDLTSGRALINKINIGGKPQTDYATYASSELSQANAFLVKSQAYLREMSSRLSITGVINSYQTWANNKLILYQKDLRRLSKPRMSIQYPES